MQTASRSSGPPDQSPPETADPEQPRVPRYADEYQLAHLGGERASAPAWARTALATEPERTMVTVEGAAIEVLSWGAKDLPGIVLLHGSRASADWWAITAPLLMHDYRVVALSSSGMGRSDRRPRYSVSQFAREAIAVAEADGRFEDGRKPIIIAHSFGGYAALQACALAAERFAGVVIVDTLLQDVANLPNLWPTPQPEPIRSYATIAQALSRFRLIPSRPTDSLWALDEIARRSLRQIPETGAWTWQFDNAFFAHLVLEDLAGIAGVKTPVAVIRGELSELYHPGIRDRVAELFGRDIPDIVIPQAGHHIMIDQPLALVTALRALLASWPAQPGADRRSRLGNPEPGTL